MIMAEGGGTMIDFKQFYTDDEVIRLAQDLVRIPSHKYIEDRESRVAEYIYDYCADAGFEVTMETVEGKRRNVIAVLRGTGGGRDLILNGHTDTVPPYDMTIDPFCAEIKDGFLWGRGANDMKGALACMITAMLAIKRSGIKLRGDIIYGSRWRRRKERRYRTFCNERRNRRRSNSGRTVKLRICSWTPGAGVAGNKDTWKDGSRRHT